MAETMTHAWRRDLIRPRSRVICDNDYCGDPDGVVQIAHHLLCASVDIRFVVSSAVGTHHPTWSDTCVERGVDVVRNVTALAGRPEVPVLAGSNFPLTALDVPQVSPGAEAIIAEAMRDDTDLPLFVMCAGGLTTIASAFLMEPRIAERLTIVWNGGYPYSLERSQLNADVRYRETNINTDVLASQVVFNHSNLPMWQVPQDVFQLAIVSRSEWIARVRPHGPLGEHLYNAIGARVDAWSAGLRMGETYGLGDCPLVLLTALGGAYDPEPYTSSWITRPRPHIDDDCMYIDAEGTPPIRVFTGIDVRLLFEDLYGKLVAHANGWDSAER